MKTSGVVARIIKYILNLAGLFVMCLVAVVVNSLMLRRPDCDGISIKLSENIGELVLRYIPFLAVMMGLNLLIERKLEKRAESREYLLILCVSAIVLVIAVVYTSHEFVSKCVNY
ncbi:hypothetical protein WBG78_22965 [Chryseolinea sp. T2]|uniref:hypothetical protein n=1 Tax=Chryseolinea sp. T2 TaxID=3129255 RepID=UPI0030785AB5